MIQLTEAELNHLRRLVAWIRCDIGQSPEEQLDTYRKIAHVVDKTLSSEAQQRLVQSYERAERIPKYIRAAVKALDKTIHREGGDIVDAENVSDRRFPERAMPSEYNK